MLGSLCHPRPGDAATRYFLINDHVALDDDEDEAAHVGDRSVGKRVEQRSLCAACGTPAYDGSPPCDCGTEAAFPVLEASPVRPGVPLRRCAACSARSNAGIVHQVLGYQDMPAAVIATALYQSLPPADRAEADDPSGARKLLCFSDSRQDAAFFASHLDRVYSRAVDRRILWKAIDLSGASNFEDAAAEARTAARQMMGPPSPKLPSGPDPRSAALAHGRDTCHRQSAHPRRMRTRENRDQGAGPCRNQHNSYWQNCYWPIGVAPRMAPAPCPGRRVRNPGGATSVTGLTMSPDFC